MRVKPDEKQKTPSLPLNKKRSQANIFSATQEDAQEAKDSSSAGRTSFSIPRRILSHFQSSVPATLK